MQQQQLKKQMPTETSIDDSRHQGKFVLIRDLTSYKFMYANMWHKEFIQGCIRTHLRKKYKINVHIANALIPLRDLEKILVVARARREGVQQKSLHVFTECILIKVYRYHRTIGVDSFDAMDNAQIHLGAAFESLLKPYPHVALDLMSWWQPGAPSASMNPKLRRRRMFTWVVTHMMADNILSMVEKHLEPNEDGVYAATSPSPTHIKWRNRIWADCLERGYSTITRDFALPPTESTKVRPKISEISTIECCICLMDDVTLLPFSGVGTTTDGESYICSHQGCCVQCAKGLQYCPICRARI